MEVKRHPHKGRETNVVCLRVCVVSSVAIAFAHSVGSHVMLKIE